ncbi:hypothetical protein [Plantactinospora endophytica]|uniref:Uncharacterized protein n=1 Tax=Plantactinospora endophytica TaxID=673535 RepID=A0ABQ4E9K5_9ACTN|nr:hypothetical protein [Plantactinospora endophytica]GIG91419.1 hypothetical protein Pen02_63550 [Plantactinospora endophytica]
MALTTAYTDAWYRQPDPMERVGDRRPTNEQWVLVATVWLLAMWSPDHASGWASTLVSGRSKSRRDQQWPEPPPLPEIADAGDLPTLTGATVLTSRVSPGPNRPYESVRADGEVSAELVTLISAVVPVRDRRGEVLVGFLANLLAGPYSDLLRLTTAAEWPSGPGLPAPLHLLHRDTYGGTLRVSLNPAPEVRQPPVFASDGADAALRTRIACVLTLLSDLLWVNNNTPVTFRCRIGRLDQGDGDPLAAAARWWTDNREDADEYDEEEFRPISATDLRAGLQNEARLHLNELLFDGEWSGIDEFPDVPADHLVTFLVDDLVDLVLARMGDDARIACAGFLPVTWPPDGEDDMHTTVLLVAGNDVAVLEVDLSD